MRDDVRPCPNCPDGNEWNSNGPSGRECSVCKGFAVVKMNGDHLTRAEWLEMEEEQ